MTQPYHYTDSGLDYIYLSSGFEIKKTPFGEGVTIRDLEELHDVIGCDIVNNKPNWTGSELRFIRKELGFTQKTLGMFVSRDAQTVALWEKNKQPVPDESANILRGIYISRKKGSVELEKTLNRINDLDRQINELEKKYIADDGGWHVVNAA